MTPSLRAAALLLALVLAAPAPPAWAVSAVVAQDTSALRFHRYRAGARLDELDRLIRGHDGRLRCDRAKRDRRVMECRGTVSDSALGVPVEVWVSAIDSVTGVLTLSAELDAETLDRWRRRIETSYGRVTMRSQGSQRMMQWVRRGRMLRLTWQTERGKRTASVSLVDGRVLDGWGANRPASP
jgi:hypothetical protein